MPPVHYKNIPLPAAFDIRNQTAQLGVAILFDAFCAAIQVQSIGNFRLVGNGFIENGFTLQSDNYEYYGMVEHGIITHRVNKICEFSNLHVI